MREYRLIKEDNQFKVYSNIDGNLLFTIEIKSFPRMKYMCNEFKLVQGFIFKNKWKFTAIDNYALINVKKDIKIKMGGKKFVGKLQDNGKFNMLDENSRLIFQVDLKMVKSALIVMIDKPEFMHIGIFCSILVDIYIR